MSLKTQKAYEKDKIMIDFVSETCPVVHFSSINEEYSALKESLDEINIMIQYNQDIGNVNEIAAWRRMLMREKMRMREIKKEMDAKNIAKEIVYS